MVDSESRRSMDLVPCRRRDSKILELSASSNILNESLLVEILARLPSREAIRFKLVCKSWCSLISSDYFMNFFNHRRHDPSLPPIHHPHPSSSSFIFQFQYRKRPDPCLRIARCGYTHHDTNLCGIRKLDLSFLPGPHEIVLKASCADLILCSGAASSRTLIFYVCNYLTKQWVALSPVRFVREEAIGFLCVPASCSLCPRGSQCVDNSRYNFMVVRILSVPPDVPVSQYKVQLFSSEEGQWKTIVVPSPRALIHGVKNCTSLVPYKGMLHWVISKCVVVYDPYNSPERFFRVIDLPPGRYSVHSFGVFQDRLRVTLMGAGGLQDRKDFAYSLWELEDYNTGKWSLVHKIYTTNIKQLRPPDHIIKEIGLVQIDGNVFYRTRSSSMWLGNVPSLRMDHQYKIADGFHTSCYGFVYWIADQPWPTPVPSYLINSNNPKEEGGG